YPPATNPGISTAQYQGAPPSSYTTSPAYQPAPGFQPPPVGQPANVQPGSAPAASAPPAANPSAPYSYPPGFATSGGKAFGPGYSGTIAPPASTLPPPGYQPQTSPPPPGYTPYGAAPPPMAPQAAPPGNVGYQIIPEAEPSVDLNVSAN